jgi:hypothetical protein
VLCRLQNAILEPPQNEDNDLNRCDDCSYCITGCFRAARSKLRFTTLLLPLAEFAMMNGILFFLDVDAVVAPARRNVKNSSKNDNSGSFL